MARAIPKHYAPFDTPTDRARRLAEHRKRYDQARDNDQARMFLRSKEWRSFRKQIMCHKPICAACGAPGRHLDHIVPVRLAWNRRFDKHNLQVLCHSCHSRKTAYETQNFRGYRP